jgi:hypothetical protein
VSVERERAATLQRVIAAVQWRWGAHALRIFGQPPADAVPAISTGFPDLNAALGIGGFPRGRITELLGMATSGKTTINSSNASDTSRRHQIGSRIHSGQLVSMGRWCSSAKLRSITISTIQRQPMYFTIPYLA